MYNKTIKQTTIASSKGHALGVLRLHASTNGAACASLKADNGHSVIVANYWRNMGYWQTDCSTAIVQSPKARLDAAVNAVFSDPDLLLFLLERSNYPTAVTQGLINNVLNTGKA